ncbi:MAG: TIGR03617 family F420-dependent LLM class oxidoreductase [Acidimicrobiales bacterium]|nr:MAG: TIGR03617 family F420-dependent LLM class oxidoreductase [Acidimicrobiales bacterium]
MSDRIALSDVAAYAQRVEALGYDTLHVPETIHDGLMVSLLALQATTRLRVTSSVILAFVRSPMLVAYTAWDLAAISGGRFELGLGSQIKQNIEGRYSMPWSEPVGRMREYVEALRAIWHTFATGEPLAYEGERYRFTRLQPFFNPGDHGHGTPPIWLGGVNEKICALGGSHADGFVTHPTNSNPRYLREFCLPRLDASAAALHRPRPRLITGSMFISGRTRADVDASREHHRGILGFLYSTPAYRRTLELYGWGDLGERLQHMTREGSWGELSSLITDEVLDVLVPQSNWADLAATVDQWFAGLVDGVMLPVPPDPADDDEFAEVIRAVRSDDALQSDATSETA